MATVLISHLGNGNGYVYEVDGSSNIVNWFPNTVATRKLLRKRAIESAIFLVQNTLETGAYTENFHDPDGYRYYLDSNSGASKTSLGSDKIEITKYVMPAQKPSVQSAAIASGVLSLVRYASITIASVSPESGNTDDLDYIRGENVTSRENDFQEGDIVIIQLASTSDTIVCKHNTSGVGHVRMSGLMNYAMKGSAVLPHVGLIKRNGDGWEELFRNGTFLQTKKVTVSGSAQSYDPITDASQKITNQEGVIFLDPSGVTQTGAFSLSTSEAVPGYKLKIIPLGAWDAISAGGSVTIFGKTITEEMALDGNWSVEAYYDETNAVWRSFLGGTSVLNYRYRQVSSGESYYENNSLVGLNVGEFMYWLGGILLTYYGSRASASFDSGTGRITYAAATDADTDAQLIILKTQ